MSNYKICDGKDNTLKQLFNRFYVIPKEPKDYNFTEKEKAFLQSKALSLISPEVKEGKNGYVVFRGKKHKKLTEQQIQEIKESNLSYRKLSEKFNVSIGTISRVKNNKY